MHLNPHIVFDIPLGSMLGLGPPRGRGIRGAPSKNAGAGIPGLGPGPGPPQGDPMMATPCLNIFRVDINGALGCLVYSGGPFDPQYQIHVSKSKSNDLQTS